MHTVCLRHHPPHRSATGAPLLFVHGGFVNSRCWDFHFLPFFQERGHDCFALDFSGHGESDGHDRLDTLGLDDYLNDLHHAAQQIGQPTILIGHSMGARVVERYLRQGSPARAAILMAPVPASGTAASAFQLSLHYPGFHQAIQEALDGRISAQTAALLTRIYFSPAVTPRMAERYLSMIGRESSRAIVELLMPELGWPARSPRPPTLMVTGGRDEVFPASALKFTALAWAADLHCEPEAGHLMMLGPHWENIANAMLAWIDAKAALNSTDA